MGTRQRVFSGIWRGSCVKTLDGIILSEVPPGRGRTGLFQRLPDEGL